MDDGGLETRMLVEVITIQLLFFNQYIMMMYIASTNNFIELYILVVELLQLDIFVHYSLQP